MLRARTPTGDPAARASPLPRSKTPDLGASPGLEGSSLLPKLPSLPNRPGQSPRLPGRSSPLPNLPNLPNLPGQSPGLPGRKSPLPNLPNLPHLPVVGTPLQPGWRRRHKLNRVLGGSKKVVPLPVPQLPLPIPSPLPMGPDQKIKGRKRARVQLFVTRVKLRMKGVKTPSVSKVAKGQAPVEAPVATPVPVMAPASPRL